MTVADRVHARLVRDAQVGRAPDRASVAPVVRDEAPLLAPAEVEAVVTEVLARATGLGPLEALMADADVTEVMVNGPDQVWVERAGVLQRVDVPLDRAAVEHVIEKIVAPLGLRVDRASPMVDARLPDGSRVNAVVPPLAVDGPCLTIRRFGTRALPLRAFAGSGTAALLRWAVRARMNVLVSGGTSSGKTTLLNALAAEIPAGERIVTVEDAAELRLGREHVVRLEARPANAEGAGEVRVRDLVRNALRMRPDRIVVGEVRDAAALDMLQAMDCPRHTEPPTNYNAVAWLHAGVRAREGGLAILPWGGVLDGLVARPDGAVVVGAAGPQGAAGIVSGHGVVGELGAGPPGAVGRAVGRGAQEGLGRGPRCTRRSSRRLRR